MSSARRWVIQELAETGDLVDAGLFNGAYWFDADDAAAWRAAFDRFGPPPA